MHGGKAEGINRAIYFYLCREPGKGWKSKSSGCANADLWKLALCRSGKCTYPRNPINDGREQRVGATIVAHLKSVATATRIRLPTVAAPVIELLGKWGKANLLKSNCHDGGAGDAGKTFLFFFYLCDKRNSQHTHTQTHMRSGRGRKVSSGVVMMVSASFMIIGISFLFYCSNWASFPSSCRCRVFLVMLWLCVWYDWKKVEASKKRNAECERNAHTNTLP